MKLRDSQTQWSAGKRHNKKREKQEKIFATHVIDKVLIFSIHKELLKVERKKGRQPLQNMAKDLNRQFTKEDTQWPIHMLSYPKTSLVIR